MSRTTTNVFVATLIAVFAGQALAADVNQPKSREQVQAELSEAIRTGNILDNVTGQMLKDAYPERYVQRDVAQARSPIVAQVQATQASGGKSREEVQAELAEAVRTGDILDNVTGQMLKDAYPERYSNQATAQAKANDDKAAVAQANATRR